MLQTQEKLLPRGVKETQTKKEENSETKAQNSHVNAMNSLHAHYLCRHCIINDS